MGIQNMIDLKDKVAIVTGSSKGLGHAYARAFAEAGAHLVITCRHGTELKETADAIRKLGSEVLEVESDISVESQVKELVHKTEITFGRIDILVNNAAAGLINIPLEENTLGDWSLVINKNINGTYLCCREVANVMMKQKKGKIVNIASISGFIINKYFHGGSYNVSKSAVVMLTKACAVEWAPYNIQVNAIAPGYYNTEPNRKVFEKDPALHQKVLDMIPLGRLGNIDELAALVVCLSSDITNYMTGSTIIIDGGYTLW